MTKSFCSPFCNECVENTIPPPNYNSRRNGWGDKPPVIVVEILDGDAPVSLKVRRSALDATDLALTDGTGVARPLFKVEAWRRRRARDAGAGHRRSVSGQWIAEALFTPCETPEGSPKPGGEGGVTWRGNIFYLAHLERTW